MFLTENDVKISTDFLEKGYVIRPVSDIYALSRLREYFIDLLDSPTPLKSDDEKEKTLNEIHKRVAKKELNDFRLKIIRSINSIPDFREMYYRVAKPYLESIVGNELAMQLRVNLSIQYPGDDSSLLPIHADTWSGDSPYEVVVWLPLVDCYGTKSMYILPPKKSLELSKNFTNQAKNSSEDLYASVKEQVEWLTIKYGEVLIFNQALPHGNRVNQENETRWSMNCRFKGVFTPYGDKKIGEFFEPITLRAASQAGMISKLPAYHEKS